MTDQADRQRTIQRAYRDQVAAINGDLSLTPTGRRQRLAQLKLDADAKLAELDTEASNEAKRHRDQLVSNLFGQGNRQTPGGELYSALREAEQIRTPEAMLETLRLARLSGHDALVTAIGAAAETKARTPFGRNQQWGKVLDEWAQDRPNATQQLQQLADIDRPRTRTQQLRDRLLREMRAPAAREVEGQDLDRLANTPGKDPA